MAGLTYTTDAKAQQDDVLLRAVGLQKMYDKASQPAVDGVDLTVRRGEIYVLMGLSGSGKSTILRMLNRLIEPTSGTVELAGEDLARLNAAQLRDVRNRRISMVFQHFALFPHRSVRDNAAYGLRLRGVARAEADARAEDSLRRVGLGEWGDAKPAELSGGMKQRVGLARALCTDAEILLMDEPFSALDPLIRHDMQDLLVQLASELHRTVVFVTHDLNEAMRVGHRITLLARGRVAQTGTAAEILTSPADDYVRRFVGEVDRMRVLTARDVMSAPDEWLDVTPTVHVRHDDPLSQIAPLLPGSGSAAVLDGQELVGYITSDHVLAAVGEAAT